MEMEAKLSDFWTSLTNSMGWYPIMSPDLVLIHNPDSLGVKLILEGVSLHKLAYTVTLAS